MGKKTAGKWKQAAAAMKAKDAEEAVAVSEADCPSPLAAKEAFPKAASPPSLKSFADVVEAAKKAAPEEVAAAPADRSCSPERDRAATAENRTSGACACVVS